MSAETMLAFLDQCSLESRLGFFVASHCAPVLKGIKISNIMTAERGTWKRLVRSLKGSNILCVLLSAQGGREVLLLYRYEKLREHLMKEQVRKFLESQGYDDIRVPAVITRLRKQYAEYVRNRQGFPHELGVVLEYPVEDVEGFIRNKGKNCLLEKYWKVYQNKETAKAIFAQYDKARELAMQEVIAGYALHQISV